LGKVKVFGLDPSFTSSGFFNGKDATLIKTKKSDDPTMTQLIDAERRVNELIASITAEISKLKKSEDFIIYCESPMLNGAQANHLFEVGCMMMLLHLMFRNRLRLITPSTLKKYLTGKGNAPKSHDPTKCGIGKKPMCVVCGAKALHSISFDKDPGLDKIHAWGLWQFGMDVQAGLVEYVPLAIRGSGKGAKAKQRAIKNKNAKLKKAK
jgi:hypothetical protein